MNSKKERVGFYQAEFFKISLKVNVTDEELNAHNESTVN